MIISRTPYRVSFFGGGTDYHAWYEQNGGQVLTSTINHYCYISCRALPPFFDHKSKVVWSKVEQLLDNKDIEHPCVNGVLEYLKIEHGVEIHHQGDLPARSGLGSSSAFCVGLLNAVYAMLGKRVSKEQLAREAIHIERDLLKENVGIQDQIETAYGGLNKIAIQSSGDFTVEPIILLAERKKLLQQHCMLFFTGLSRTASDIAGDKIKAIPSKTVELNTIHQHVDEAISILTRESDDLSDFGRLLDETWRLKRSISSKISPDFIDDIYAKAKKAGALGGKLLGAGGGGFILFFVEPEKQAAVMNALEDLLIVPFEMENSGSQIIFYDETRYSRTAMVKRDYRHLQTKEEKILVEQE